MKNFLSKINLGILSMAFIFSFDVVTYADSDFPTFEIEVKNTVINLGEPLVVELKYHFKEPQLSNKNEIFKQIDPEAYLCIDNEDGTIYEDRLQYLFKLVLQDEEGLAYKGTFVIWYNVLGKKLFFNTPGEYTVRTGLSKEFLSNPVKITVKSEIKKAQEALVIFNDLNDYLFLFVGLNENPEKRSGLIARLKQVQKESRGTMLEKWSAARLGVEYFNDIQYGAERDQSKVNEIQKYLNTGIDLSDEFPIREETLYRLSNVESMKGNNERAVSLLDELIEKYPKGRFVEEAKKSRPILAQRGNLTDTDDQTTTSINSLKIIALLGLSVLVVVTIINIGKKKGFKL